MSLMRISSAFVFFTCPANASLSSSPVKFLKLFSKLLVPLDTEGVLMVQAYCSYSENVYQHHV